MNTLVPGVNASRNKIHYGKRNKALHLVVGAHFGFRYYLMLMRVSDFDGAQKHAPHPRWLKPVFVVIISTVVVAA